MLAILAVQMLALENKELADKFEAMKADMEAKVIEKIKSCNKL